MLRRRKINPELAPLGEYCVERNAMAREWGLRRQWIVCPSCGEQSWVLPPHGLAPCPLVEQMMEDLGLKIDAERSMALRTGLSIEEMARVARELGGDGDTS